MRKRFNLPCHKRKGPKLLWVKNGVKIKINRVIWISYYPIDKSGKLNQISFQGEIAIMQRRKEANEPICEFLKLVLLDMFSAQGEIQLKNKQKASEQELNNLFNSLMQRAFNGELA